MSRRIPDPFGIDARAEELVLGLVDAGVFEIDDLGRIWRVGIQQRRGPVQPVKRRRAEYPATNGYLRLRVKICGVQLRVQAHRIVYRYHVGPIPRGMTIDHTNTKKTDNRPGNLEPVTNRENTRRRDRRRRRAA